MLVFDDNNNTILIETLTQPILTTHFWTLNLPDQDFMLSKLVSLEQTTCPTLELTVENYSFPVPATWSILIYDIDTLQIDVVSIAETAGREFTAVVFGPNKYYPRPATITATNYFIEFDNVSPVLSRAQMLCHPINPDEWICLSPSDGYTRYLKNLTIGSLIT